MKIALVCFGHTDVVLPLFKNLKQNRVDINLFICFALNRKSESIIYFEEKEIMPGFLPERKVEEILQKEIITYLGDISPVHFFIYYNLKLRSIRNLFLSFVLANKLKDYDVIHFSGTNGVLPILIFLLRNKKLIFTIHDIHSHSGEKTRLNFSDKMNKYIIKSKYALIVQNLADYEYLKKTYLNKMNKIKFIPFGVLDIYREIKGINEEKTQSDILLFGRISPYKGIEYLVSALEKLKGSGIHLKTVIAGKGGVYFDTSNFDELGIELINKHVSNEELVSLISRTKIVICPYTDATQSGVVMTAFALHKPVIASAVGSFPEVIKDGITGFLVPPKDPDALASKIALLISDMSLLKKMGDNIQIAANTGEYSWQQITQKMQNLYFNMLA